MRPIIANRRDDMWLRPEARWGHSADPGFRWACGGKVLVPGCTSAFPSVRPAGSWAVEIPDEPPVVTTRLCGD
ncbi:hypothetical protein [Kibdelosporangium philippinense]|uniref:hypothetical protein n=1 Tax=Kibdelosporangium philippinense TaxID=211113 RepID=UPI00360A7B20